MKILIIILCGMLFPDWAFAAESLEGGLTNIKEYLTGDVAQILAVLAVVLWGINMLTNWISVFANLRSLVVIFVGILIIFGAGDFVSWVKG